MATAQIAPGTFLAIVGASAIAALISTQLKVGGIAVPVVVLSAIVPTAIAQRWFSPAVDLSPDGGSRRRGRPHRPATEGIPATESA